MSPDDRTPEAVGRAGSAACRSAGDEPSDECVAHPDQHHQRGRPLSRCSPPAGLTPLEIAPVWVRQFAMIWSP